MKSRFILYMIAKSETAKIFFPFVAAIFLILNLSGCTEEPPVTTDGRGSIEITAMGDMSLTDAARYVPLANAKAFVTSEYGIFEFQTDEHGVLKLENLPSSIYNINIKMRHPDNSSILISGNLLDIPITTSEVYTDTLFAVQTAGTGIAINEIYASGPVNDILFYADQYIELYNYSDKTKYLDGMIIYKFSAEFIPGGTGSDTGNDGDIDGVNGVYKFPGNPGEKNYPFEPHTFKVLATLALNHKIRVHASIDLSNADWEFYNPYSATDFDNPNVPNIVNIISSRTIDLVFDTKNGVLVLASGEDKSIQDGVDISTIIDGIQYRNDNPSVHTLDTRVDKSTVLSSSSYSGKSMQRREEGYDTNNGKLDWIIGSPTPGCQ
ncbi:MAG TPA: DUF4876 domain-containing protein [Ignavibacteriales bacterium]|nr:DUF4876 domain-containing protein [Ignavibacteriales bacterium]